MPTRVLMLRHGETSDPDVFHGAESDVGLSERGRIQAEAAAAVLPAFHPVRIISSGMRRALETAAPIVRACGVPLQVEIDLHERSVGDLGGKPTHHRDGVWPDTLRRWLTGDTAYAPHGAESYDAICSRVLPVWERLTTAYHGQTIVIVAHGVVCKVLLLNVLPDLTLADWTQLGPIRNVGVHELVCEQGNWRALRLNDVPVPPEMPFVENDNTPTS
jgi:2,3-bisphosphoglycerate-dependent phosphoglycerate mutase